MKINYENDKIKQLHKEILRKAFHVTIGLLLLIFYLIFGRYLSITLYTLLLGVAIISDLIRIRIYIQFPLKKLAETLARSYEKTYVGAHTYSIAGFLISSILFQPIIFIVSSLTVTIIDPIMSVCGLLIPKPRIPYNRSKSLVGSIIGSAVMLAMSFQIMNLIFALFLSVIIFILDSLPIEINDNILYPVIVGLYISVVNGNFI